MAAEMGPFPGYARNRDAMLRVMRNHRRAAYASPASDYEGLTVMPQGIDPAHCEPALLAAARGGLATGRWSSASSTATATRRSPCIAPTGTIGLVMDCDTTGIEPDFALVKFKKLAGGGYFKIVNQSVPAALRRLGYTAAAGRRDRRATRSAPARWPAARTSTRESLRAQGFDDDAIATRRGGAAERVRRPLRVQPLHARRRDHRRAPRRRARPPRRAGLRPADGARLRRRGDRGGERLRLRHDDGRGRAAPQGRAPAGVRLRQPLRQEGHALHPRRWRTSR